MTPFQPIRRLRAVMPSSLRSQLTLASGLTLAAGLATLCLAGNALLASTMRQDASAELSSRLDTVVASITVTGGRLEVHDTLNDRLLDGYAWVSRADGHVLESPTAAPLPLRRAAIALTRSAAPIERRVSGGRLLGSRPIVMHGRRLGTVVADLSVATLDALLRRVLLGSMVIALLTLLVGVLAIRRALGAALAPVQQMTEDAENWGAHDLDRRFQLGPERNEISSLAATLDHLLARIAASRRHEQRFASEVAHELRTPLAAIRGVAELAADTHDLDEARSALHQIGNDSRRIATTIDTLVAFARREATTAVDGVDLQAVAEDFDGITVRRIGGPLPRVEGDPGVVRQALAPLVDNALRHAASQATIELASGDGQAVVIVRDDGPGVDPALGHQVFLPGVQGAGESGGGAGLGLPLALRLVRSCGGDLSIGEGPGGCFVVRLPLVARSTRAARLR